MSRRSVENKKCIVYSSVKYRERTQGVITLIVFSIYSVIMKEYESKTQV